MVAWYYVYGFLGSQPQDGVPLQVCDGETVHIVNPWKSPEGQEARMALLKSTIPLPPYHPRILEVCGQGSSACGMCWEISRAQRIES